jgi:hypothetical protein
MMRKFAVVMCIQEEWDEPNIVIVEAEDEDQAWEKGIDELGYSEEEIEEGIESGQIAVVIKGS